MITMAKKFRRPPVQALRPENLPENRPMTLKSAAHSRRERNPTGGVGDRGGNQEVADFEISDIEISDIEISGFEISGFEIARRRMGSPRIRGSRRDRSGDGLPFSGAL
jgi:hypothetical protein